MIKTNSLQKQQNKERNEKENRKKIAKILPQIEVFMKGLPNFTIFKKLIDLQILHFEFEVIKIFSNKKFLVSHPFNLNSPHFITVLCLSTQK